MLHLLVTLNAVNRHILILAACLCCARNQTKIRDGARAVEAGVRALPGARCPGVASIPGRGCLADEEEEAMDGVECNYNIASKAASHESTRCMQVLLDFGVDVNRERDHGWTPLMYACAADVWSVCACSLTAKQTCSL
jgi:hypothetical protein